MKEKIFSGVSFLEREKNRLRERKQVDREKEKNKKGNEVKKERRKGKKSPSSFSPLSFFLAFKRKN